MRLWLHCRAHSLPSLCSPTVVLVWRLMPLLVYQHLVHAAFVYVRLWSNQLGTNWELQAVTSMPNGGRTADPGHLDELRYELRNELLERKAIQTVGSP